MPLSTFAEAMRAASSASAAGASAAAGAPAAGLWLGPRGHRLRPLLRLGDLSSAPDDQLHVALSVDELHGGAVAQMRGALSQRHAEDPTAYERAQYMKALTYYKAARP